MLFMHVGALFADVQLEVELLHTDGQTHTISAARSHTRSSHFLACNFSFLPSSSRVKAA